MTRKESLEAIKNLQAKLNDSRKETEEWRMRCLSLEHTIQKIVGSVKDMGNKHDDEHGTMVFWRM
jgi:hypothetical protein